MTNNVRNFKNETQEVRITITEAGSDFYFTNVEYRDVNSSKEFKQYNGCAGIYEGIKALENSIKGFCKRHNLVEVK